MAHGGARQGAGRKAVAPSKKRVTLGARVTPETKRWLENQAMIQGLPIGRVVDILVAELRSGMENEI